MLFLSLKSFNRRHKSFSPTTSLLFHNSTRVRGSINFSIYRHLTTFNIDQLLTKAMLISTTTRTTNSLVAHTPCVQVVMRAQEPKDHPIKSMASHSIHDISGYVWAHACAHKHGPAITWINDRLTNQIYLSRDFVSRDARTEGKRA